jgi:hypothetical protein
MLNDGRKTAELRKLTTSQYPEVLQHEINGKDKQGAGHRVKDNTPDPERSLVNLKQLREEHEMGSYMPLGTSTSGCVTSSHMPMTIVHY